MNRKVLIAVAASVCFTLQFAYGQQNSKTDALKQKAVTMLSGIKEAVPVVAADNVIGLMIDSVKKTSNDYELYFNHTNKNIQRVATGLVMGTYFIDPENYKNYSRPVTIDKEGFMDFTYTSSTPEGDPIVPVKLKTASKIVYVYFSGVKDPKEVYTVPLFFTIVLGDKPYVLEQTPRYAGTLFDEAIKTNPH
jgi:hypothetical protein